MQFVAASDIFSFSDEEKTNENSRKVQNRDHSSRNTISNKYPKLTQLDLFTQHFIFPTLPV